MLNAFAELIRQYLDVFGLFCAVMLVSLGVYFTLKVAVFGFLDGDRIDVAGIVKRPVWRKGTIAIAWCCTATAALWWSTWILR